MRQYLITERAHLTCPNMHFGILLEMEVDCQEDRIRQTLNHLALAHPFLRSMISREEETGKLYYDVKQESQIELHMKEQEALLWEDYRSLSTMSWNVFQTGLLKVYVYPMPKGMKILFVQHHLLVDGRGALQIAEEFADDYVGKKAPGYAEEHLIQELSDLPTNSRLPGISRMLVKQANKNWQKEKHSVSYEAYLAFEDHYLKTHPVAHQLYELNPDKVNEMLKQCHENQITMNDLLMAYLYQKTGTDKIIIAADIRKELRCYQAGALGNYATATGVVYKCQKEDIIKSAKEIHKIVQKNLAKNSTRMLVLSCYLELVPELLDAAAITALGGFESKAAGFVGEGMFHMAKPSAYSITNLGRVENEYMKSVVFIPPASPAAKLTLGVVTLNGHMTVCSSEY